MLGNLAASLNIGVPSGVVPLLEWALAITEAAYVPYAAILLTLVLTTALGDHGHRWNIGSRIPHLSRYLCQCWTPVEIPDLA